MSNCVIQTRIIPLVQHTLGRSLVFFCVLVSTDLDYYPSDMTLTSHRRSSTLAPGQLPTLQTITSRRLISTARKEDVHIPYDPGARAWDFMSWRTFLVRRQGKAQWPL